VKGVIRRPGRVTYRDEEAHALLFLSDLFDGACSKRLRAAMDVELPRLHERRSLPITARCYQLLMRVSPATIDRLLVGRRVQSRKARGFTKPGTSLKDHIPIPTWADWTEDRPGFCGMDLVDHSGGRVIPGGRSRLDTLLHRPED